MPSTARRCPSARSSDGLVEQVLVSGGRATGVALAGGEKLRAPVVVTAIHPPATFLEQVERAELPAGFVTIGAIDRAQRVVKINLALAELPDFTADPGTEVGEHHTGSVEMALSVDYVKQAFQDAKRGRGAARPFSDGCIPRCSTRPWPRRHPCCRCSPSGARTSGPGPPPRLEAYADRMVDCCTPTGHNLKGAVCRGGDRPLADGARVGPDRGQHLPRGSSADQLFHMRPAPGYADYRSPIAGLTDQLGHHRRRDAASRLAGRPGHPGRPQAGQARR